MILWGLHFPSPEWRDKSLQFLRSLQLPLSIVLRWNGAPSPHPPDHSVPLLKPSELTALLQSYLQKWVVKWMNE